MIYGTPYFINKQAAIRYYKEYGYSDIKATIERKLADVEIHLGRPELKEGENLLINHKEGRYFIESI